MLDVNASRTVTIAGKQWTLRALPFAVMLECQERESQARAALQRASRIEPHPTRKDLVLHVPIDDSPEARAAHQTALDAKIASDTRSHAEALRWGLRAYADGPHGESATVDGRTFRVLSPDAVSAFAAWGGDVALELAKEVLNRNALSADDLLGFLQPSGS